MELTRRQRLEVLVEKLENELYINPTMDSDWFDKQSELNGHKHSLQAIKDREINKGKREEGVTPYRLDVKHT